MKVEVPEEPQSESDKAFWAYFLEERKQILKLKWIESKKAGRDIGYPQAIKPWLKHRKGWQEANSAEAE